MFDTQQSSQYHQRPVSAASTSADFTYMNNHSNQGNIKDTQWETWNGFGNMESATPNFETGLTSNALQGINDYGDTVSSASNFEDALASNTFQDINNNSGYHGDPFLQTPSQLSSQNIGNSQLWQSQNDFENNTSAALYFQGGNLGTTLQEVNNNGYHGSLSFATEPTFKQQSSSQGLSDNVSLQPQNADKHDDFDLSSSSGMATGTAFPYTNNSDYN